MTPKEQFHRAYSIVRYNPEDGEGDYAPRLFDEKRNKQLISEARGIPPAMLGAAWLCYEIASRCGSRRPYQAPGKYQKLYDHKHQQKYVMMSQEAYERLKTKAGEWKGEFNEILS